MSAFPFLSPRRSLITCFFFPPFFSLASSLLMMLHYIFLHLGIGAVSSDAAVCANISADVLRQGGSAVDAAIAAMLCNGVVQAESSGIGGGGFMLVRLANGSVYSLNFREAAPSASSFDMYHSDYRLALRVWFVILSISTLL